MVKVEFKNRNESRLRIAQTGKSLRQFALSIGVSQSYLSQLLNGEKNPSPTIAHKIAQGLDVSMEEIFLINMIDKTVKDEVNQ